MGKRIVKIDLDKALDVVQSAPDMIAEAVQSGLPIPASIADKQPLLQFGLKLFGKFVEVDDADSNEISGLPGTGTLGKGRALYLNTKKRYSDEHVKKACDQLLFEVPAFANHEIIVSMKNTLDFVIGIKFNGVSLFGEIQPSYSQYRESLDTILSGTSLPEKTLDKFGDMLFMTLTTAKVIKKK